MHRIAAHLPDYDRFVTFCLGAAGYGLLEYLYRGRTHWTMLLAGGAALVLLRGLNRRMAGAPLVLRALAGALAVTGLELAIGLVCNRALGWAVWDCSALWGNLWGQVCPLSRPPHGLCWLLRPPQAAGPALGRIRPPHPSSGGEQPPPELI